jgi:S-adenosylmethionine decarboxylase
MDHFTRTDHLEYAGTHLLVDLWGAENLTDCDSVRAVLVEAAREAGATILGDHFHHFGEGCGVTGVVVLSESHISIHTWPERGFAAIDMFMCGRCDPETGLPAILRGFAPGRISVQRTQRGLSAR